MAIQYPIGSRFASQHNISDEEGSYLNCQAYFYKKAQLELMLTRYVYTFQYVCSSRLAPV